MNILANVLIPTIAEHIVIMLALLFPVALIEAIVIARRHFLKYGESLKLSLHANLKSTLVGIPVGYIFALLGIIPAGFFATLLPDNIGSSISVILGNAIAHGGTRPNKLDEVGFYMGTLLVMVPYFLVTLYIERREIIKLKAEMDTPALTKTVRIMNGITYGLLSVPVILGAIFAVIKFISNN